MRGALYLIFNCDESRTDNGGSARLKANTVRDSRRILYVTENDKANLCAVGKCTSKA